MKGDVRNRRIFDVFLVFRFLGDFINPPSPYHVQTVIPDTLPRGVPSIPFIHPPPSWFPGCPFLLHYALFALPSSEPISSLFG